jgi:thiol-disulfide isomerase/thioredoxin
MLAPPMTAASSPSTPKLGHASARGLALVLGLTTVLTACAKEKEPALDELAPRPTTATSAAPSAPPPPPAIDASLLAEIGADAGLNAREDDDLASLLGRLTAPCPSEAVSVAQCVAEHRACADCGRAARYLAGGVHQGWAPQYLPLAFRARFDPKEVVSLPIDGSPVKGPATAGVTIVEFGSYVCPHCAAEAPKLDALQKAHPKDIRIVFKPSWSPQDPNQMEATRAALAAAAQGKFWEMHALLFANQPKFDVDAIDAYAKTAGVDSKKLHAAMESPAVTEQMAKDAAAAAVAKIDILPSIFINGRPYLTFENLEARIAFELAEK